MIFDIYYDKTLWAMASGYKGEDIIKFIENIPEELIEKIKNILWLYRCYLVGNMDFDDIFSDEKSKLNDSVKTSGDMLYFYSLDLDAGSLDIGDSGSDGSVDDDDSDDYVEQGGSSGAGSGSGSGYESSTAEDNVDTGVETYYIILIVVAIVSYAIMKVVKKYNLFKNI